jgi:hypothetical protein
MLSVMPLAFGLEGCALWGGVEEAEYVPPLVLTCTMDKSVYRPGEAVSINVKLHNNSDQPMNVRALDASSINAIYGREDEAETTVLRPPVRPEEGAPERYATLQPGQFVERSFDFTRLTFYSGPMKAIVQFDPNPTGSRVNGPVTHSNTMSFQVEGDRLFERDNAGLLTQQEAIALAKTQVDGNVVDANALLVKDDTTRLFITWVNLNVADAGGAPKLTSFLVDPYRGSVIGRSVPFDPNSVKDPSSVTPTGLPPRTNQTRRAPQAAPTAPGGP